MALVLCVFFFSTPAFAADDPLAIVNNLSDFVFSLIRRYYSAGLGRGTGRLIFPKPRPQPEKPGLLDAGWRACDYFCAGDPRADRRCVNTGT